MRHSLPLILFATLSTFCAQGQHFTPVGNPVITHMYSADPSARVFGKTLYLYPSHDRSYAASFADMSDYHCYSTTDLKHFTDHGPIFNPAQQTSWATTCAWAPDCIERDGRYYLYFPTDKRHIGVAVASSPTGPFTDALDHPLLSIDSPGVVCDRDFIDPCPFIDDDGQAYLYVGQNTPCVIRLNADMTSYDGEVHVLEGVQEFFEAAWVHKRNGIYYLSYSDGPFNGHEPCISYCTATHPLGPWTYRGVILPPVSSGTNHHSIVQFGDDWYIFYHTSDLSLYNDPSKNGHPGVRRSVCVERLEYNEDGTIKLVTPTVDKARVAANTAATYETRPASEQEAEPLSAYLMVYHKDQDHGLHMAYSHDGNTWTALNDDKPVISGDTIAQQHGIRDPHIMRGPDGTFYLTMTDLHIYAQRDGFRTTQWERDGKRYGWGNNRGLVVMKSRDLIHWSRANLDFTQFDAQTFVNDGDTLTMDWHEVGCVWAPETVYDTEAGKVMMHFTARQGDGTNAIWYAYMNDTFDGVDGTPHFLMGAPKMRYGIIDSDIIRVGDTYHMFYVSHEHTATPKHACASKLTGPYVTDEHYSDGERRGHEAPNCWRRLDRDTYMVMFDNYRMNPMNFGFVETRDFFTYHPVGYFDAKDSPMHRTNFVEQKHGAVTHLTTAELETLLNHWK